MLPEYYKFTIFLSIQKVDSCYFVREETIFFTDGYGEELIILFIYFPKSGIIYLEIGFFI